MTATTYVGAAYSCPSSRTRVELPAGFVELRDIRASAIERRLGYFRDDRFVIFGYCPGGGEILWKDNRSAGFGTGGWQTLLYEIAPLAAQHGAWLGSLESAGTHVLLLDRHEGTVYAAPRTQAEAYLAQVYGRLAPRRPCLCAGADCDSCLVKTCILHPSNRGKTRMEAGA